MLGELLIVPSGLALMTRLLADRYGGLGSGLWFAISAAGLWLGGEIGTMSQRYAPEEFFAAIACILAVGAALVAGS